MDVLPDLALEHIANNLSGSELAAWCAVSRSWRDKLNQDHFWRKRCDPDTAEYLRKTECQVQSIFINPEEEEDRGLSAICEWRLAYMRETHLLNNWRQNLSNSVFVPIEKNLVNIYKNDYLINIEENKIELWKVEGLAVKICEKTLPGERILMLYFSGDNVVVKQNNMLQIFEVSTVKSEFVFKHRLVSDTFPVALAGSLLIVVRNPFVMQVWNVETGEMIKEEKREDSLFFFFGPCVSETYLVLQACRDTQEKIDSFVLVYKLPDVVLVFKSEFYEECVPITLVVADHVYIQDLDFVYRYCLKTSQLTMKINILPVTNLEKFDNKVYFADILGNLIKITPGSQYVEVLPYNRGLSMIFLHMLNSKYFLAIERGFIISLIEMKDGIPCHVAELGYFTHLSSILVNKAKTKLYISFDDCEAYTSGETNQLEIVSFW